MYLQHQPATTGTCDNKDITLLSDSNLVSDAVYRVGFEVCVEGEVIEAAVSQSVALIPRVPHPGKKADFCQTGYAFQDLVPAFEVREGNDEGCGDDFVVSRALLDLCNR